MEILIILLLIVLNGIFAMAEIAIVSSRKLKLKQLAQNGDKNAKAALELAQSPNRFLSTVQIGITFVGIFAGAFGGEAIAGDLAQELQKVPVIGEYSHGLSLLIVVAVITYLSLIIGELVPKRLALSAPEKVASFIAPPMKVFSSAVWPLVTVLTFSADWLLDKFKIKAKNEPSVSEEEVKMLIKEGAQIGIFNITESDIVERTFKLSDKTVKAIMTSRRGISWLDINDSDEEIKNKAIEHPHTHFPVCKDNLENVLGIVRAGDILRHLLTQEKTNLKKFLHKPIIVPEDLDVFKLLELFKKSGIHAALITDKNNRVSGIVTLTDILDEIVGDIPTFEELREREGQLKN